MRDGASPLASADRSPAIPAGPWVRAADGLTLLLLAAAGSILLFGGFRVRFGPTVITAHSAVRLVLTALALAGLRHAFQRAPSLPARLAGGVARLWRSEPFRAVAPVVVWSRAAVFLTAYLAVIALGFPTEIPSRVSANEAANLPARWDAGWYLGIASSGYRYDRLFKGQQNVAFFPAFPLATRTAGIFLGGTSDDIVRRYSNPLRMTWAGVAVNLAAFAGALAFLFRMVRAFAGEASAAAAVQLAVAYPLAFVFNAPYSEGLFLLSSIAAFHHLGRGEPARAAAWGFAAGLSRPNGFVLTGPLLLIALCRFAPFRRFGPVIDRMHPAVPGRGGVAGGVAAALAPAAGMLAFSAYLYTEWGDPFLWAKLHAAWGRTYHGLDPAFAPLESVVQNGLYAYTSAAGMEVLHVLFFLLAMGLAVPIAWRLGAAYSVLIAAILVPPLLAGGWLSMGRMTVVLFPLYVYLGTALAPRHRIPVLVTFAMLQGLCASLFFTWRPFY
jgi:hypothetical protein